MGRISSFDRDISAGINASFNSCLAHCSDNMGSRIDVRLLRNLDVVVDDVFVDDASTCCSRRLYGVNSIPKSRTKHVAAGVNMAGVGNGNSAGVVPTPPFCDSVITLVLVAGASAFLGMRRSPLILSS